MNLVMKMYNEIGKLETGKRKVRVQDTVEHTNSVAKARRLKQREVARLRKIDKKNKALANGIHTIKLRHVDGIS